MAPKTRPDPRLDAVTPWLGLLALVAGTVARLLAQALGWAGRHGRRRSRQLGAGMRRAGTAASRGGRELAAVAWPLLTRQVWPRMVLAATIVAGVTVLALARLGESAEQGVTAAGIHADRVLRVLGDAVALVATVWAPRAWRWVSRVWAPRAWHRVAAVWVPGAGRWAARYLPVVARHAAQAAMAVVALALLALPALHVVALTVDVSRLPPLPDRSTLLSADGSTLAVLHDGNERAVVPLGRIPRHVQDAVLTAEDRRFRAHTGYDVRAMARAVVANVQAGRVIEGASTITQQLAKQNFTGGDRTVGRKAHELVYAVALERAYSKDQLLERYLNQVYFGAGAHGIAVAAWEYFRVPPEDLTVDQAALLAALIRSPSRFDPRADPDAAEARRDRVLEAMVATGTLAADEAAALAAQPVELAPPRSRAVRQPHLVEAVRRELLALPALGDTPEERDQLVRTGGVTVHTTIDVPLQEAVADVVAEHLPDPAGPTAAAAVVEPGTGRVLALHAGRDFRSSQFDLAAQARRQPGSLFKPFAVAAALEAGADPEAALPAPARATFDLGGERWVVRNYGGGDLGTVDLATALATSANTAFAALAVDVGTGALVDVLERVGVDPDRALGPPASRGPSIALGGITYGVSPLEMAAAYAVFADAGRYHAPHLVERVVGPDGQVLHDADATAGRALAPGVAREVAAMLRTAVEDGTGSAAALADAPVAGKTGTTQHGADAWFAGVTDGFAAAVWVGHPDGRTPMPQATGGRVAAPIWRDIAAAARR